LRSDSSPSPESTSDKHLTTTHRPSFDPLLYLKR